MRTLRLLSQILLVISCVWTGTAFTAQEYLSPTVIDTGNVWFPFPTVGPPVAAVSLLATVESDGHVSETQIIDAIGSTSDGVPYPGTLSDIYIEGPVAAVKQWRFSPATDRTLKRTRSVASITFVYQRVFQTFSMPGMKTVSPRAGEYLPPLARRVSPVGYPLRSFIRTVSPRVVLKLRIEADSSVSAVEVVESSPDILAEPSAAAAMHFYFQPARYEGKPTRSTAFVAFVFLLPRRISPK